MATIGTSKTRCRYENLLRLNPNHLVFPSGTEEKNALPRTAPQSLPSLPRQKHDKKPVVTYSKKNKQCPLQDTDPPALDFHVFDDTERTLDSSIDELGSYCASGALPEPQAAVAVNAGAMPQADDFLEERMVGNTSIRPLLSGTTQTRTKRPSMAAAACRAARHAKRRVIPVPEVRVVKSRHRKTAKKHTLHSVYKQKQRLPVDELALAPFLADPSARHSDLTDENDLDTDPVEDSDDHRPQTDQASRQKSVESREERVSLTELRHRFKLSTLSRTRSDFPKLLRSSVASLEQGRAVQRGSDGFVGSELYVTPCTKPVARGEVRSRRVVRRLTMVPGPLPDVVFVDEDGEGDCLDLSSAGGPSETLCNRGNEYFGDDNSFPLLEDQAAKDVRRRGDMPSRDGPSSRPKRRVTFSDYIDVQLSGISAPARSSSESSLSDGEDEELEEDKEAEVTEEDDSENTDSEDSEKESSVDEELACSQLESRTSAMVTDIQRSPSVSSTMQLKPNSHESIQPSPEDVTTPQPQPAGPILMRSSTKPTTGNDRERLLARPVQAARMHTSTPAWMEVYEDILDDEPVARPAYFQSSRPKSILKHATSNDLSKSEPNQEVEPTKSNYFASAARTLSTSDSSPHKILRRRSKPPTPPRLSIGTPSKYHNTEENTPQLPNETAPYSLQSSATTTNKSPLPPTSIIHTQESTYWSSAKPVSTSKDLTSLTRTVSRDFGTLSGRGRRPSLPFVPPLRRER
ncbi:hypothetical protein LTR50_006372 [Elasticomyces elasticus]|nr:hypothetical protein LTR50_006372 [Elasticomyces elasticus]